MTTATDILRDAFERVHELVPGVVEGLDAAALSWRPDPDANPVGWLVWHLTRVQDDHLAGVAGRDQVYPDRWAARFALPYPVDAIGYGHSRADVDACRVEDPALLAGYHAAVHARTLEVLDGLDSYERVVDDRWDPPVTAAARLVSVVNDTTQHVGQAAYVRGLLDRR